MSSNDRTETALVQYGGPSIDASSSIPPVIFRSLYIAIALCTVLPTALSWWSPVTKGMLSNSQIAALWLVAVVAWAGVTGLSEWWRSRRMSKRANVMHHATPSTVRTDALFDQDYSMAVWENATEDERREIEDARKK